MTVPFQTDLSAVVTGVNMVWVLVATFLIFFMHAGFAMLEAGQVRSKNVANQLTKNLLTWSVGVMAFFLAGAAVSSIVGHLTGAGGEWSVVGEFVALYAPAPGAVTAWTDWLFGAVFAMTAATIVSGAVAGRAKLRAYVSYTVLLAAVIYPVVVGFTWAGGFLGQMGFHDFAGGMVVHGMGGLAGLTAAYIIGPRMDRFNPDGSVNVIPGHSLTFAALGTLVLAFGWYGFNVGTAAAPLAMDGGSVVLGDFTYVGRVALVTTLGMAAGAIGAGGMALAKTGKVDTLYVANGLLAGLVGITSIADAIVWPGAIAVGLLAGAQLPVVFEFVEKRLHVDDVCAVFPVHGSAGVLGALSYPFVATSVWSGDASFLGVLGVQALGVAVIGVWTVGATAAVFGPVKAMGEARVSPEHEREGLDTSEHGVETYPEFGQPDITTDGSGLLRADGGSGSSAERSQRNSKSSASPETGGVSEDSADRSSGRSPREDGAAGTSSGSEVRTDGGSGNDADLPNEGGIKLVTAIVRPDKLGAVKQGLAEVGAPSLTVTNVSGRGSQPAKKGQWRGEEYTVDLHQKVKVETVVADIPAQDVVDAVREAARTGDPGDGKVFVSNVESATQVRTGKTGRDAV